MAKGKPYRGYGGPRVKRDTPEAREQIEFFNWVRLHTGAYPVLRFIRADRAGTNTSKRQGAIDAQRGCVAGVWDIMIDYPSGAFHCAYIEMKSATGRLREEQKAFQQDRTHRCLFEVCRSWISAVRFTVAYLGLPKEMMPDE